MDPYKTGGAGAGAIAGFFVGGPLGAVIGGVAGFVAGGAIEAHQIAALIKQVDTAITLGASAQAVQVKAGGKIGVLPPSGGSISAVTPGAILPAAFMFTSALKEAILTVTSGGTINIAWKDPSGNSQATVLTVVTV